MSTFFLPLVLQCLPLSVLITRSLLFCRRSWYRDRSPRCILTMLGAALARSARLSPAQLATHLASPNPAPLIIPHIADDWPARSTWALSDGLQKLRHHIGEERAVEVELGPRGRGYLDQRYKRISVGFGALLHILNISWNPYQQW